MSRVNGSESSVFWSGVFGTRLHAPGEATTAPLATSQAEPAPEAAAPGSSTALHDLFRNLPSGADATGTQPPADGAAPDARPRNEWLGFVNMPTIKLDLDGDD